MNINYPTLYLGPAQAGKSTRMLHKAIVDALHGNRVFIYVRDKYQKKLFLNQMDRVNREEVFDIITFVVMDSIDDYRTSVVENIQSDDIHLSKGVHFFMDLRLSDYLLQTWQKGHLKWGSNVHINLRINNAMLDMVSGPCYPTIDE